MPTGHGTVLDEVDSEYSPEHFMRCNNWCLDLIAEKR